MNSPLPRGTDVPKITFADLGLGENFVLLAVPAIVMKKQVPNAHGTAFYRNMNGKKVNVKVMPGQEIRRV